MCRRFSFAVTSSELSADEFLTFNEDQAPLAHAAGLPIWKGKNAPSLKPSLPGRKALRSAKVPVGSLRDIPHKNARIFALEALFPCNTFLQ